MKKSKTYKIIIICGKSGTGKDTILQQVVSNRPDWHRIVQSTSRPIRQGERNDIDYHFYNEANFTKKILEGKFIDVVNYNEWWYGTEYRALSFNNINIGCFDLEQIDILAADYNVEIMKVFQIETDPKKRLLRLLERETNPDVHEIVRRFSIDEKSFRYFNWDHLSYELIINNNEQELGAAVLKICNAF